MAEQDAVAEEDSPDWMKRYDELHVPGRPMSGPWTWEIPDHSMAVLCGGGEDAIVGHILALSPCKSCADRADPKEWVWGRCTTPTLENARLIAAAPDLLAALRQLASNAEIAKAYLPNDEQGSIVSSALFDTINEAFAAIAKAESK